jgi:hypothetical protein
LKTRAIPRKTGIHFFAARSRRTRPERGPFLVILGANAPGDALIETLSDPNAYVPPPAVVVKLEQAPSEPVPATGCG